MAVWMRELNLLPEWSAAQDDEISPQEMAGVIAKRLRALHPFGDDMLNEQRDEIADEFEAFSEEESASVTWFDDIMGSLYDWADTKISGEFFDAKKACWVRTL